jgi:hypothetical protein
VTAGARDARGAAACGVARPVATAAAAELPIAIPAFLEACAKLAAEAAASCDLAAAEELIRKGACAAAGRERATTRRI